MAETSEAGTAAAGGAIAPWWHTVLVLMPLAALSIASWRQGGLPYVPLPHLNSRLAGYLTALVAEWIVVWLIWLALRRRGLSAGSLVSGRWKTAGAFFRDLGIGVGFLVIALPLTSLIVHLVRGPAVANMGHFTPKSIPELLVFLVLAIAGGGFAEEFIFRGYLMRQFDAWTGSRVIALLLQGVLFGLGHGYYGRAMVAVMLEGCLLGALAEWRRSLRPGMMAHGLQDMVGGIAGFLTR